MGGRARRKPSRPARLPKRRPSAGWGCRELLQPLSSRPTLTRTTVVIGPVPATRIEAATDEGEIRTASGDGTEPISEIELELSSGDAAAL